MGWRRDERLMGLACLNSIASYALFCRQRDPPVTSYKKNLPFWLIVTYVARSARVCGPGWYGTYYRSHATQQFEDINYKLPACVTPARQRQRELNAFSFICHDTDIKIKLPRQWNEELLHSSACACIIIMLYAVIDVWYGVKPYFNNYSYMNILRGFSSCPKKEV